MCVLTKCWVYREGAVPLRCWAQGSSGDSMRGGGGRRRGGERNGGLEMEGLKGGMGAKGMGGRGVTKEVELIKQRDSLVVKHDNFL